MTDNAHCPDTKVRVTKLIEPKKTPQYKRHFYVRMVSNLYLNGVKCYFGIKKMLF
jgi:hypothetical protein